MSPLQILKAAKELIKQPENWCQFAYARDKDGNQTNATSPMAIRWCSVGAVEKARKTKYSENVKASKKAFNFLRAAIKDGTSVLSFNDGHSHRSVMALFDRAIRLASKS